MKGFAFSMKRRQPFGRLVEGEVLRGFGSRIVPVEVHIRVKDNGHGIAPEDRSMICKRYCTSKIRDLEDLHVIGGRFLGFRGEALASAAEMSGRLTICTRIEGEETASELCFDRQGRIARYVMERM